MKKITTTIVSLFAVSTFLSAQMTFEAAVAELNEKAKETHGVIRKFKNSKVTVQIHDNEVKVSDRGISIKVVLDQEGFSLNTYTYDFDPAKINTVKEADMPDESPIGQISIKLWGEYSYNTNFMKKGSTTKKFESSVNFNFLKVDPKNKTRIIELFNTLKRLALAKTPPPIRTISSIMSSSDDFWISRDGVSKTYSMKDVQVSNCEMRIYYTLKTMSKKGTFNYNYLTIVRLDEIADINLDTRSRPNFIMLEAGRKGFENFSYVSSDGYKEAGSVSEVPLFINQSNFKVDAIIEYLNTAVKGCGGKKLKL